MKMNVKFEFKATLFRLIFYLIATNGLIAIILFLLKTRIDTAVFMFCVLNISYLISILKKPIKLVISQGESLLEIHYLFNFLYKCKILPLNEIECTFRYEIRARGGKADVLRLMFENKTIVELLPDYSGWDNECLRQIFEKLNDSKNHNDRM